VKTLPPFSFLQTCCWICWYLCCGS